MHTFSPRNQQASERERIRRVLHAYAAFDPAVGYVQASCHVRISDRAIHKTSGPDIVQKFTALKHSFDLHRFHKCMWIVSPKIKPENAPIVTVCIGLAYTEHLWAKHINLLLFSQPLLLRSVFVISLQEEVVGAFQEWVCYTLP